VLFSPTSEPLHMPDLVDTRIQNRWMVQPNHANTLGAAHGGNVLKWMDEAGAMSAVRFSGETCVTAHMDEVNFKQPVPVGETAFIDAYVYGAGRSSVNVRAQVYREDLRSGRRELTTNCYMVFVAIDEANSPVPVPDLTVSTEQGERLYEAALEDAPE
jgi:acyl-CoA hydrolase